MADETTTTPNDAPGNATGFDVSAAFFGIKPEVESDESDENSDQTPPGSTAAATDDLADDGDPAPGDNEPGEAVEVWQFNGAEYSADQVSAALKNNETFERFNQSIAPLVENIKQYGETAERIKLMGTTECENQITELKKALASGRLNAKEYQEAHMMLTKAETRKGVLEQAAAQEVQQRNQALQQARTHNARQVATALVKSGWTKEQMNGAQMLAQQAGMTPDQFADSLSTGLMEILRDAAELRAQKGKAAEALRDKATKAIKIGSKPAAPAVQKVKKSKAGDADWMAKNFWGGAK